MAVPDDQDTAQGGVSSIITEEINRILASRGIQIPEQPRTLTPAEQVEAAFARVEAELKADRVHTSGSDGVHLALLAALQAVHQYHYHIQVGGE